MSSFDVIVVGGGVSGLVFAEHAAAQGRRVLVLEKSAQPGGCLNSWQAAPGFFVEMAAHTAYNSYGDLLRVLEKRGRLGELLKRAKLGYHFLKPDGLQSPMARLNFVQLLLSLPFGLFKDKTGTSLRDYYGALLGPDNYARVLGPAFAAVLSQPCDNFPAEWLFRRKPRLEAAPRKYSWASGLQGLLQALVQDAPYELRTGAECQAVTLGPEGYRVTAAGDAYTCRTLALAIEPDVAARLLAETHADIAGLLAQFPMASIESLAVVLDKDRTRLPALAGLIGVDDAFYSVVSRDPVPHERLRAFTFHFRPGRYTPEAKLRRAAEVLGCAPGDFQAHHERINRLPSLDTSHPSLARRLDDACSGKNLALIGNYFRGMSIGDCAERAVDEAQRLFSQGGPT
jgi:oxygen-dependent protoporphyrinogen oxidase